MKLSSFAVLDVSKFLVLIFVFLVDIGIRPPDCLSRLENNLHFATLIYQMVPSNYSTSWSLADLLAYMRRMEPQR